MTKCVLNVTDHEFDRILQLNHDTVVLNNTDHELLEGLEGLVGKDTVDQICKFDECRMEKHHGMVGIPRIQSL